MKISVIVPIYNIEKYICKCLDSLINQTLKEIEIICIDDCSSDYSKQIVEKYKENDERITLIENKSNQGVGFSRNVGIKKAKGEYIAFVDPDDWVDKNFLEKLYKKAKKKDYDIVKGERKVYFNAEKIEKTNFNNKIKKSLKKGLLLCSVFNKEFQSAIYKREFILQNNIEFPNFKKSQDIAFLLQAAYFAKKYDFISNVYYYYFQRSGSAVRKYTTERYNGTLNSANFFCDFINNHDIDKQSYLKVFKTINDMLIGDYHSLRTIKELSEYKFEYIKRTIEIFDKCNYKNEFLNTYKHIYLKSIFNKNNTETISTIEKFIESENKTTKNEFINKLKNYFLIKWKK